MDFDLTGIKRADHQGTLHIINGQNVKLEGHVRLPWNGRFQVKGPDAHLALTLLTLRRQRGEGHGVVYNRGGQVRLDRVEFHNNEVSGDGGAVTATGATSRTVIDNCDFHQNQAGGAGGAVTVRGAGAELVIAGAHFLRNRGQRGGAVAVLDGGTATISDCKFHLNSAALFGGGVYFAQDAGRDSILRRAELAANTAGAEIIGAQRAALPPASASWIVPARAYPLSPTPYVAIQYSTSQFNSFCVADVRVCVCVFVGGVDVSLVDRGAAVFWKGDGRYDRAWQNNLELTVDRDSKVEGFVATSVLDVPPTSSTASAPAPGPPHVAPAAAIEGEEQRQPPAKPREEL